MSQCPPRRVALLIDADNISLNCLEEIVEFASYYGHLEIQRAYGDWKQSPLSRFRVKVDNLKIKCVQVDRVEKDATDKQLMIGADEILGGGAADLFIIVSGDGDFKQLYKRIKKKKRTVVGIGHKKNTSPDLRKACDDFVKLPFSEDKCLRKFGQHKRLAAS